jgi:hypothetical protein
MAALTGTWLRLRSRSLYPIFQAMVFAGADLSGLRFGESR